MNRSIFQIIAVISVFFYTGCKGDNRDGETTGISEEIIDFYSFEMQRARIPEKVIQNITYIKLDNSRDDILFSGIDKIRFTNDRIYVLDRKLMKLIVFRDDGTAVGAVGKRGQGPEDYLQITDFDVTDSGSIYMIDGVSDKLFVFDGRLQFVSAKKLPFEADIVQCLSDGNHLMFGLSSWNKGQNSSIKVVITGPEFETVDSYLKYEDYRDDNYWISWYTFLNTGDKILYNNPIDNSVYEFSTNGQLEKLYRFDFGKKNVPDEDRKDIERNMEHFRRYCCLKNFTAINDKYIMGTLWDEQKTKNFILDRHDRTAYISEEIADSDISNMAGYYRNQIIAFIYPGKYENIQLANLPDDVKEYIEDENFVVCLYELK